MGRMPSMSHHWRELRAEKNNPALDLVFSGATDGRWFSDARMWRVVVVIVTLIRADSGSNGSTNMFGSWVSTCDPLTQITFQEQFQ